MAYTVKLRLKDKTVTTRGVEDRDLDRATIRAFASTTDSTTGGTMRIQAIDQAILDARTTIPGGPTDGENYHNEITDLPLASVSALAVGQKKLLVDLDYRRLKSSKPRWNSFDFAQETQGGFKNIKRWKAVNVDSLCPQYLGTDGEAPPSQRLVFLGKGRIPIRQIIVTTRLAFVPEGNELPEQNTINEDQIAINGVMRSEKTLHYEGINVHPFDTHDGIQYVIQYVFRYNPAGWFWQQITPFYGSYPCADATGQKYTFGWTVLRYRIRERSRYKAVKFKDQFPTHQTKQSVTQISRAVWGPGTNGTKAAPYVDDTADHTR
jgi:hypothetical protein